MIDTATSGAALVADPSYEPRIHRTSEDRMNIRILSACFVPADDESGQPVLLEEGGVYALSKEVGGLLKAAGRGVETEEAPAPPPAAVVEARGKKGGE